MRAPPACSITLAIILIIIESVRNGIPSRMVLDLLHESEGRLSQWDILHGFIAANIALLQAIVAAVRRLPWAAFMGAIGSDRHL